MTSDTIDTDYNFWKLTPNSALIIGNVIVKIEVLDEVDSVLLVLIIDTIDIDSVNQPIRLLID